MLNIPVSQYFLAMVPCIMYYEITDLPYAFLVFVKLLWSTERCLKCFLDVLSKPYHEFVVHFYPALSADKHH